MHLEYMNYKIPVSSPLIGDDDKKAVIECLESNWISGVGGFVDQFESAFSRYVDCKFGVATNSGTTSLHLALASLGLKKGDEIIIPTFTMIASINAAEYLGLNSILVDADPNIWTMDTDTIKSQITDKTRAIMAVHIYGHPENMKIINELASKFGLYVIEDAAEAHGAEVEGRKVGSLSNVGSFSFYANKIITTGEGGMCVSNDRELSERMAWLRAHAFGKGGKHFWHEELGFGYRMSALLAALGYSQTNKIELMVEKRRRNAKIYNELLYKLAEAGKIKLPPEEKWAKNVYWMYSILVERKDRDPLMKFLESKSIESRTFFYPVHRQPYYRQRYEGQRFPNADKISSEGINLPSGNLLSEEDVNVVVEEIMNYYKLNR